VRAALTTITPGTTSLLAALNVKTGKVIGEFHRRYRAKKFRKFLDTIDAAVPTALGVHMILEPRHPQDPLIHQWLARRLRFHVHFNPTVTSWIKLVERWFATLTDKQLRRGVHRVRANWRRRSCAISTSPTNARSRSCGPRPADEILASVARFCH
jgi:hypothetical protein